MPIDLKESVVRILNSNGVTEGTGFVVSSPAADGLIITCLHVLPEARAEIILGHTPEPVTVVFRANGESRRAVVRPEHTSLRHDVAVMRLEGELPAGVRPLILGASAGANGHPFSAFGFLKGLGANGIHGGGKVSGHTSDSDGLPLLQLTEATEITHGFSGAPVVDILTDRVIGMVTSITLPDEARRLTETALSIPTETLLAVCPALSVSDVCPYRSLSAFTENDAEYFFGRRQAVNRLCEKLRGAPRLLTVLGPSGSGKSSLTQAGLIPRLRKGQVPYSDRWKIVTMRPADYPFKLLEEMAADVGGSLRPAAIGEWLARRPEVNRLMLVIDQFEELLASGESDWCQVTITQLAELLDYPAPISLVIVMRDDFFSRFTAEVEPLLKHDGNYFSLPSILEEEDLMEIVTKPAEKVGLRFEEGLAKDIVSDALETAASTGEARRIARSTILPLLEFALTQLWERRKDGLLLHRAYRAIGRVTGSLTQWADQAYYSLNPDQRLMARRVFTDLVHLGNEQEGVPDTRRRRSLTDLRRSGEDPTQIQEVISHLTSAETRLLTTSQDHLTKQEQVELIHEALLREWSLLRNWLREDKQFLQWRQALEQRARAWDEGASGASRRDEGRLLRGRDLNAAEDFLKSRDADLTGLQIEYIQASQRQARSELEEARRRAEELSKALNEAERQARVARARELAAHAQTVLEPFPQRSLLLALEALMISRQAGERPVPAAEESLRRSLAFCGGERLGAELGVIRAMAASSHHRRLAALTEEGKVYLWDLTAPDAVLSRIALTPESSESAIALPDPVIAFSPDGRWLVASRCVIADQQIDNGAWLWDLTAPDFPNAPYHLRAGGDPVVKAIFGPSGRWLATCGRSLDDVMGKHLSVHLWDLNAPNPAKGPITQQGSDSLVSAVAISPGDHWLAAIGEDKADGNAHVFAVHLWDLTAVDSNNRPLLLSGYNAPISEMVISPDGRWLFASSATDPWGDEATRGHAAFLWDLTAPDPSAAPLSLRGHEQGVRRAVFSPDGQWLATIGGMEKGTREWDPVIRLWNLPSVASPASPIELPGHEGFCDQAAFSPDGRWLVTCSRAAPPRLWDLQRDDLSSAAFTLNGHESRYVAGITMDISRKDGSGPIVGAGSEQLISASIRNMACPGPGPIVGAGSEQLISAVAFSPDSQWLITGGEDGAARVWNLAAQDPSANPAVLRGHTERVSDIAVSPDSQWLATAGGVNQNTLRPDNTARLWRLSDKQPARPVVLRGHEGGLNHIFFSQDGRRMVTTSEDGTTRVWEASAAASAASPLALRSRMRGVSRLAVSSDNRWLAAGGTDGRVSVWRLRPEKPPAEAIALQIHKREVSALAFSPDSRWLATAGGWDGTVRLWDMTDANPASAITSLRGHEGFIAAVCFTGDGRWLVTGSWDGKARFFDLKGPRQTALPLIRQLPDEGVSVLSASPDGRWLAVGGGGMFYKDDSIFTGRNIYLWDLAEGGISIRPKHVLGDHGNAINCLAFSADSQWLASGGMDHLARLWKLDPDAPALDHLILRGHEDSVSAMAFSRDNRWLVTGGSDSQCWLWDLTSVNPAETAIALRGHEAEITALAMTADGRRLITASKDGATRLWDLTDADPASTTGALPKQAEELTSLAISPDDAWFVAGGRGGGLQLWSLRLEELMELACHTAGRNLTEAEWARYFPGQSRRATCQALPLPKTVSYPLADEGAEPLSQQGSPAAPDPLAERSADEPTPVVTEVDLLATYVDEDFSIDIPVSWLTENRSADEKRLVYFSAPDVNAQVVLCLAKSAGQEDSLVSGQCLKTTVEELFGSEENFYFTSEPYLMGNGKTVGVRFGFDRSADLAGAKLVGLSLIRRDNGFTTVLSFFSEERLWESLTGRFIEIVNSLEIPPVPIGVLRTYFHPGGVFSLDIPGGWEVLNQSDEDEIRISFVSPRSAAKVTINIAPTAAPLTQEEQKRYMKQCVQRDLDGREGGEMLGEPELMNGSALGVGFIFRDAVQGPEAATRGISISRLNGGFVSICTLLAPDRQFDAYARWFVETVNSLHFIAREKE